MPSSGTLTSSNSEGELSEEDAQVTLLHLITLGALGGAAAGLIFLGFLRWVHRAARSRRRRALPATEHKVAYAYCGQLPLERSVSLQDTPLTRVHVAAHDVPGDLACEASLPTSWTMAAPVPRQHASSSPVYGYQRYPADALRRAAASTAYHFHVQLPTRTRRSVGLTSCRYCGRSTRSTSTPSSLYSAVAATAGDEEEEDDEEDHHVEGAGDARLPRRSVYL